MKRSFPAILPVPIFNQKKRNRQPLISTPQKNEASAFSAEGFDFPPVAAADSDSMWPGRNYANNGGNKADPGSTEKKAVSWYGDEDMLHSSSKDSMAVSKRYEPLQMSGTFRGSGGFTSQVPPSKQTPAASSKRSQYSFTASSTAKGPTPSYAFKSPKTNRDDVFADMPEEEMVQAVPLYRMTFKEQRNTLRIITVSIESMKRWSEYTDRVPLLFEMLATLDSAVTSGRFGSKSFILRDGRNHIQCVFYEIDRELPRLIRGRVHRVMGNYNQKGNLFKCVSVRPASAAEQHSFPDYVLLANKEMERCVKTMNET